MENRIEANPAAGQQALKAPVSAPPRRQWVRSVPAARIQWSKLTVDELFETQGELSTLSALVQERYALTREQADDEVAGFLDSCKNWF
jgi:hypothetical protein